MNTAKSVRNVKMNKNDAMEVPGKVRKKKKLKWKAIMFIWLHKII